MANCLNCKNLRSECSYELGKTFKGQTCIPEQLTKINPYTGMKEEKNMFIEELNNDGNCPYFIPFKNFFGLF